MWQENSGAGSEDREMTRGIMLRIGWLAATGVFLYIVLMLNLRWSLLEWSPILDKGTIIDAICVFVSLAVIWLLGKASHDTISCGVAVFACSSLVLIAIVLFPVELATQKIIGCAQSSPLWYRAGRTLLLCIPGGFCFWWIWQYLIRPDSSAKYHTDIILKNRIKRLLILIMLSTFVLGIALYSGYGWRKSYQIDRANKTFDPLKHSLSGIYLPRPLGKPSIFGQLDHESEKRIRALGKSEYDSIQKDDMELIIHASDGTFFVHFK